MVEVLTARPYQAKDIDELVSRAAGIIPKLPNYQNMAFSKVRLEYVLKHNLNPQSGFGCWVLTNSFDEIQGIGCGYCVPGLFSTDLVANDVFLYVEPQYRSLRNADTLITAFKSWAIKEKGAKLIVATHTSGLLTDEQMKTYAKFLGRHGFVVAGNVFYLQP